MTTVKYNRADINSAVEAAIKLKAAREVYIVPTAGGYCIMAAKPPAWQNYIVVKPDGSTEIVRYNAGKSDQHFLPCPECDTPNPLPAHSLFVKCRSCGARLIKVNVIKNKGSKSRSPPKLP